MRIVVAACTVDYAGRLSASLPEARRLLVVKADGSVLVHADSGGYKPLNWMSGPCALLDGGDVWEITNAKGERLTITFTGEVVFDSTVELGAEPGLAKDGVEAHLQELLAAHPHEVEAGLVLVRREHATAVGPVDLLCRDTDGCWVAVEIKRRGEIAGVAGRPGRPAGGAPGPDTGRGAGPRLDGDRLRPPPRPRRRNPDPVLTSSRAGRPATGCGSERDRSRSSCIHGRQRASSATGRAW